MSSLNHVTLLGALGANPKTHALGNGEICAVLSVTTDRQGQGGVIQTEWHRVYLYGALAERAARDLRIGAEVLVEGRLRTDRWTDARGARRTAVVVVGRQLQVIGAPHPETKGQDPADWLNHPPPEDEL